MSLAIVFAAPARSLPLISHFEIMTDGKTYAIDATGKKYLTTIDGKLQNHLQKFIKKKGDNPISAVVVVDTQTGDIKAAAYGRALQDKSSPLFFSNFPCASLFKTVVSAAAFDLLGWSVDHEQAFRGGCANVRADGAWLRQDIIANRNPITLRKAYMQSCNGYFAKVAVEGLGYGALRSYAQKFSWYQPVPADFSIPMSPMFAPESNALSIQSLGQFAAGLGKVYTNVFHVAWQYSMVANGGRAIPLRLFQETPIASSYPALIKETTSQKLRELMPAVVSNRGTAGDSFHTRRYRELRNLVGGKTGTLSGTFPQGVNTWFAGMMPINNPRYVVASIVVINDLWHIRGSDLAAEAFWALQNPSKVEEFALNSPIIF